MKLVIPIAFEIQFQSVDYQITTKHYEITLCFISCLFKVYKIAQLSEIKRMIFQKIYLLTKKGGFKFSWIIFTRENSSLKRTNIFIKLSLQEIWAVREHVRKRNGLFLLLEFLKFEWLCRKTIPEWAKFASLYDFLVSLFQNFS